MRAAIEYNLPDDLDLYLEASKAKSTNTLFKKQVVSLKADILQYMVNPSHEELLKLQNKLEAYVANKTVFE